MESYEAGGGWYRGGWKVAGGGWWERLHVGVVNDMSVEEWTAV